MDFWVAEAGVTRPTSIVPVTKRAMIAHKTRR
jgi:hypothetical protein